MTTYQTKGKLLISLDFELHWGGFEKWSLQDSSQKNYQKYFMNTRQAIPLMLALFEQYGIHVTWATVGLLMHENREQIFRNAPLLKPGYLHPELSAYHYMEKQGIGPDETSDPFHYAATLVNAIRKVPHQEIGSHTFSHFYCNEEGQTVDQFKEDMKAAIRAAGSFGLDLKSLVFPRNQFNDSYLRACYDLGITSVRSNPLDWFWKIDSTQGESWWKRLNRGADAYLPVGKDNTYSPDQIVKRNGYPLCIPASRLLRPYRPKELFLNQWKIDRIRREMSRAAESGLVYHLWWHPHNFGDFPEESLSALRAILMHFDKLRSMHGMESMNMRDLTEQIYAAG